MGWQAICQIFKKGGINSTVATPNFLQDIGVAPGVYQVTWYDNQQGGLDQGTFLMRQKYEVTTNFQAGNWIYYAQMGGTLSSSAAANSGTLTVTGLLNADGLNDLAVNDYILISDGTNTELFQVSNLTGTGPWTITLGSAPGVGRTTTLNSFGIGTRVCRLVYSGYITQRLRTTELTNDYELVTAGWYNRLSNALGNLDCVLQDAGTSIYNILNSFSGTLTEIIVTSGNIAQATGFTVTSQGSNTDILSMLTDILRQENALASPTTYALYTDATRSIFHKTLPSSFTQTIDLKLGSQPAAGVAGDQLGPYQTTDMDITGLVNTALVQGGKMPNGQQLQIIVQDTNSQSIYGYFEGVLTNTDLTDINKAAAWAAAQLNVIAYPRNNTKVTHTYTTMRLTCRDYLKITGFDDASTQTLYPIQIQYEVDANTGIAISTAVNLAQLRPDIANIMAEYVSEVSVRSSNQAGINTPVGDAYVVRGFDIHTNQNWATVLPNTGPQAWWRFDEASGNAVDNTQNGNTLTAHGTITYSQAGFTGDSDHAVLLDGSTGYYSSSFTPVKSTGFSVEALIEPSSGPSADQTIVDISDDANNGFWMYLSGAGHLTPVAKILIGGTAYTVTSASALTAGTSHILEATYNGSTLTLYVDGVSVGTASPSGAVTFGGTFTVGRNQASAAQFFKGVIDDTSFFPRYMAPSEVSALFTALSSGVVTITDGVVRWLGIDYYVPQNSFNPTQLVTIYGANVNASPPDIESVPSVIGLSQQNAIAQFNITTQGGIPSRIDSFTGCTLWRVTVLGTTVVGTYDLRPKGAPLQGSSKNLVPDSDIKFGNHFWPDMITPVQAGGWFINGLPIVAGAGQGGANAFQYTVPANPNGGTVTQHTALGGTVGTASGVCLGPDGKIWFANGGGAKIFQYDPVANTVNTYTTTHNPRYVCAGPDGNVWYTAFTTNLVVFGKVTPAGTVTEFTATRTGIAGVFEICCGADGNLWSSDTIAGADALLRCSTAGVITVFAVPTASSTPRGCVNGPDGRIWFCESAIPKIAAFDLKQQVFTEYTTGLSAASQPTNMTVGPDGNMWFCEFASPFKIGKVTTGGTITEVYTEATGLNKGLIVGTDGNLWTTVGSNIHRLTIDGSSDVTVGTYAGTQMFDITPDGLGNIWFLDYTNDKPIQVVIPAFNQFQHGAAFAVPVPATYTASAYIDASGLSAGHLFGYVKSADRTITYATLSQAHGNKSRLNATFTITQAPPGGGLVFDWALDPSATYIPGMKLTFSNPQVELGTQMTDYQPNVIDDASSGVAKSTMFKPQAGIIPNVAGVPANFVSWTQVAGAGPATDAITFTSPACTVTFPDLTQTNLPAMNITISNLKNSTTYFFDVAWSIPAQVWTVTAYLTTPSPYQRIQDLYQDGYLAALDSQSITTLAGGGGSGGGGSGGGSGGSCPATYQLLETKRGMVRADQLEVGMHLRAPDGGWNRINALKPAIPCMLYRVTTDDGVSVDVNDGHLVRDWDGDWVRVTELKPGTLLEAPVGIAPVRVVSSEPIGLGRYVPIDCENHDYVLGRAIGHNGTNPTCPATFQLIQRIKGETAAGWMQDRRGDFVRADQLKIGDLLRDPEGGWNEITNVGIAPCIIWMYEIDGLEQFYVNDTHAILSPEDAWVIVCDMKIGQRVKNFSPKGVSGIVTDVQEVGPGYYVPITCERHRYVMGEHCAHNVNTL